MSALWPVGTKVECINAAADPGRYWATTPPVKGGTYTVAGHGYYGGRVVIFLAEIDNQGRGYRANLFRPVQKRATSIEVFRALLNPSPADKADIELADFIIEHALPLEQIQ